MLFQTNEGGSSSICSKSQADACDFFRKEEELMTKNRKHRRSEPPNFLGQHLMHNKKLINEIVEIANVTRHDLVLEFGAGKGALTSVLSKKARGILAIEYEGKFVSLLKEKFAETGNVKIIHHDILQIQLPKEPFIVVSNIPYSITTPIMKMLLNHPISGFQRGAIVMEKGAAKRFTSQFVKDPYIIAWRMWFDIRYVKEISKKNFSPQPKVDSALITIKRKVNPKVPYKDYFIFWGFADYVLQNPQMPIDFALRGIFTAQQIKRVKRSLGIKSETPVGILSIEQWGMLFETMVKYVPKHRWPKLDKRKLIKWKNFKR